MQSCFYCWACWFSFAKRNWKILKEHLLLFFLGSDFPWVSGCLCFHQQASALVLGDVISFLLLKLATLLHGFCHPLIPSSEKPFCYVQSPSVRGGSLLSTPAVTVISTVTFSAFMEIKPLITKAQLNSFPAQCILKILIKIKNIIRISTLSCT